MTSPMESRYEGNFLDALDLPEGMLVPVTIEAIADPFAEKDAAGKAIKSAILAFKGKHKRLILNATNYKNLKAMFGRHPKDWIGKQINIQRRYLDAKHGFGVENTLAIRIIPPIGTPILVSAARFLGQPTPYGQPAQKQKPKPDPEQHAPASESAPEPSGLPSELSEWVTGIRVLESLQSCSEFREQILPDCPEAIRGEVEQVLVAQEKDLRERVQEKQ